VLRWRDFALVEFLWGPWSSGWDYSPERTEAVTETLRTGDTVEHAVQYYRDTVRPQAAPLAGAPVARFGPAGPGPDARRLRRPGRLYQSRDVQVRRRDY